tara:strand:+ start:184 stop:294 length:111 start_codon:yes stop_codon:yes gene_type:complete
VLEQQLLKVQAQRKPKIEPDHEGDDAGWEAMKLATA